MKNVSRYHLATWALWSTDEVLELLLRPSKKISASPFSTNQDFPESIKIYATYRMRAYGYWLGRAGIEVINNVRWGTEETFTYCFEGIPTNSIVSIGTVGGGPRKLIDRDRFEIGLFKMVDILQPHTILVYGSAKGACFDKLRDQGIHIISYQSKTARVFEGRKRHE